MSLTLDWQELSPGQHTAVVRGSSTCVLAEAHVVLDATGFFYNVQVNGCGRTQPDDTDNPQPRPRTLKDALALAVQLVETLLLEVARDVTVALKATQAVDDGDLPLLQPEHAAALVAMLAPATATVFAYELKNVLMSLQVGFEMTLTASQTRAFGRLYALAKACAQRGGDA